MKTTIATLFFILQSCLVLYAQPAKNGINEKVPEKRNRAQWDGTPRLVVSLKQFDPELYLAATSKPDRIPESIYRHLGIDPSAYKLVSCRLLLPIGAKKQESARKGFIITFESLADPWPLVNIMRSVENIEGVCPLPRVSSYGTINPNDYKTDSLAHYEKVRAREAWFKLSCLGIAPQQKVIAIIDNGVNLDHADLTNVRWVNPAELANGIDDDGNTYVDDFNGFDMTEQDNYTADTGSWCTANSRKHGTHVAGIAAAQSRNGLGISSSNMPISPSSSSPLRIMALKADAGYPYCDGLDGAAILWSLEYAYYNPADVVNMSWGFEEDPAFATFYSVVKNVIWALIDRGAICVAAAGNDNQLTDSIIPANMYGVLTVGSTAYTDVKSSFSNFGAAVSVMAPGENIYSCHVATNNSYTTSSGTSMAAPLVAGFCGLIKAYFPNLTVAEVQDYVKKGATNIYTIGANMWYSIPKQLGSGRLDMAATVDSLLKSYRIFPKSYAVDCNNEQAVMTTNINASYAWTYGSTSIGTGVPKSVNQEGNYTVQITMPNPDPSQSSQAGCVRIEQIKLFCDPCIDDTDTPAYYKRYNNESGSFEIVTHKVFPGSRDLIVLGTVNNTDPAVKRHEKFILARLDPRGKIKWKQVINPFVNVYALSGDLWIKPVDILIDDNAFYIVSGVELKEPFQDKLINKTLLIRTDTTGGLQWVKEMSYKSAGGLSYPGVKSVSAVLIQKKIFILDLIEYHRAGPHLTAITKYDINTATWSTRNIIVTNDSGTHLFPVDLTAFLWQGNIQVAALMREDKYYIRSVRNHLYVFDQNLGEVKKTLIMGTGMDVLFFKKVKFDPMLNSLILAGYTSGSSGTSFHGIIARLRYTSSASFSPTDMIYVKNYHHIPVYAFDNYYSETTISDIVLGTKPGGDREYAVVAKLNKKYLDYVNGYGHSLRRVEGGIPAVWKVDSAGDLSLAPRRFKTGSAAFEPFYGPYFTMGQELPGVSGSSDYVFLFGAVDIMRWKNKTGDACSDRTDMSIGSLDLLVSASPLALDDPGQVEPNTLSGAVFNTPLKWRCCGSEVSHGDEAVDCNFDIPGLGLQITRDCSTGKYTVKMTGTTSRPVASTEIYVNDRTATSYSQKAISSYSNAFFEIPDTFSDARTIFVCMSVVFTDGCARTLCADINVGHTIYRTKIISCDVPYNYTYTPQCPPATSFLFTSTWGASSATPAASYQLMPGVAKFQRRDINGCLVCEEIVELINPGPKMYHDSVKVCELTPCKTKTVPFPNWPCGTGRPFTVTNGPNSATSPLGLPIQFQFCAPFSFHFHTVDDQGCPCDVFGDLLVVPGCADVPPGGGPGGEEPFIMHVEKPVAGAALSVFPNPTTGLLNIRVNSGNEMITDVSLYDITGKLVMGQIDCSSGQVQLKGLAAGHYTLVATLKDQVIERYRIVLLP